MPVELVLGKGSIFLWMIVESNGEICGAGEFWSILSVDGRQVGQILSPA